MTNQPVFPKQMTKLHGVPQRNGAAILSQMRAKARTESKGKRREKAGVRIADDTERSGRNAGSGCRYGEEARGAIIVTLGLDKAEMFCRGGDRGECETKKKATECPMKPREVMI